jgi:hypothetical protein
VYYGRIVYVVDVFRTSALTGWCAVVHMHSYATTALPSVFIRYNVEFVRDLS